MEDNLAKIVCNPKVLVGKPVIEGTRLSVEFVLGLMAAGMSEEEMLREHPTLTKAGIAACLAYARDLVQSEKVFTSAA